MAGNWISTVLQSRPLLACAVAAAALLAGVGSSASAHLGLSSNVGTFWQISDPHVDEWYAVGSDPVCDMPICCRQHSSNSSAPKAGTFGDYRCDIPLATMLSAFEFVASQKPDFVLDIGDIQPHDLWLYNESLCLERLSRVAQFYVEYFDSKGIKSMHVVGNHDSRIVGQFAAPPDWQWFLGPLASTIWKPFLDTADQVETVQSGAFYAATSPQSSKLRIISLNTQFADPLNFYALNLPEDPGNQLAWLATELDACRHGGQLAIIACHIPLGMDYGDFYYDSLPGYSKRLLEILEEYEDVVQTVISGHIHTDSTRILTNATTGNCFGYQLASPSLTTFTYLNPSIRKFVYDRDSGKILDVVTYNFDLDRANAEGKITWFQSYSMVQDLELPSLDCPSFQAAMKRLWTDDDYWRKYYHYYTSLYTPEAEVCVTTACRRELLCAMEFQDTAAFSKCLLEHV